MEREISKKFSVQAGAPNLIEILGNLSGSQLHTILLATTKTRLSGQSATSLLAPSKVTSACNLDGRLLNKVESLAYASARDFAAVELSPLLPLGAIHTLTGLDQGNVLGTIRAFECASDPTIGLALECARRRKKQSDRIAILRLCTNQRVIRFPEPTNPAYSAHFKLFSMVTAGRDSGSFAFEISALREHLDVYLDFLHTLRHECFDFKDIVVELSDTRLVQALCGLHGIDSDKIKSEVRAKDSESATRVLSQYDSLWTKHVLDPAKELCQFALPEHLVRQLDTIKVMVAEPLRAKYPALSFTFNLHRLTGLSYYHGPTLHIKITNHAGDSFMLADGGFVDWTQRLLSDSKERMLTSAIGTELLCRVFTGSKN